MSVPAENPVYLIIAGPNGAGKTTLAREFFPREGGMVHFANAYLIAAVSACDSNYKNCSQAPSARFNSKCALPD